MPQGQQRTGPTIWLLTDDRPGNRTQALGAARALGLPAVEKPLRFRQRKARTVGGLGPTLATLDDASRAAIAPPYPDLVIAAGGRVAPVAAWLRREAGAAVALIGRRTPEAYADLVVRPGYLVQPPHPKLLQLDLPLTRIDPEALDAARREPDPLAGLRPPRVVLLVGGPTGQHEMTLDQAARMAAEVAAAVDALRGGLALLTSRRTPAGAAERMAAAAPAARVIAWSADAPSPYDACLAQADLLVVTGESESMIAEAVAAGKSLTIYPLAPKAPPLKSRLRAAIARRARSSGPLAALCRKILADGWVSPRRDLDDMHALIVARGWGRLFDGALNRAQPAPHDERRLLAARLRALLERGQAR